MNKRAKKDFDCIAFKRKAQERIYEATKNMTLEEKLEYFNRRAETGPLGEWWKSLKKHPASKARTD